MEWLEFRPWSAEVAQKLAAVYASEAARDHRSSAETKRDAQKDLDGWQARLKCWPRHNPWGAEA